MRSWFQSLSALAGLVAALAVVQGSALAAVPDDDRITSLVLSSGGVAQVQRSIRLLDQAVIELPVPLDQLDDVLKSLVVSDPEGGVAYVVLDGQPPVQESFARLPFGPEALASPAALAAALPGAALRATSGGRTVQGSVLGVKTPPPADNGQTPPPLLSVMTEAGQVQTLRLGPDTMLDILDESLRERIQAMLQASRQRHTGTQRIMTIALEGKGTRDVDLTYVVAAPVWKSAYRLLVGDDDQARLQGWAVLENATGQDWKGVDLTLESGAPVVLSQKLSERYWNPRLELPVAVGAALPPRVDRSAMLAAQGGAAPPAPAPRMARDAVGRMASAPQAFAPHAVAEQTPPAAREGQVSVRYQLPEPVTAASGQTVSVPFLDARLAAELLSVFQPDRGGQHPVAGIWLQNETSGSLPPGILTVYDAQGAHIGDAQLPAVPVGESRLVYFAEDRKVEVRTEQMPQERVSEVRIADGVLRARRHLQRDTLYTIKGAADASRTVMIEHPRQAGWDFTSDAWEGDTATHHRLKVTAPEGGTVTVKATATRVESQEVGLLDIDADGLLHWSGNAMDDATRQTLEELAALRRAVADAERRERALQERLERAVAGQERIRANLAAVPGDSELGQRYLAMLAQEEDEIGALRQKRDAAAENTARRREDLARGTAG
ncbi:MAG: DUF4139 domain-containing protein [Pigmentiphaga sp.]